MKDSREIKGYRFTRITSMPVVLADTFEVDEATTAIAQVVARRVREVASSDRRRGVNQRALRRVCW